MKKYLVTFTRDYGETYENRLVECDSFTGAYIKVDLTLPPHGAITDISTVE